MVTEESVTFVTLSAKSRIRLLLAETVTFDDSDSDSGESSELGR